MNENTWNRPLGPFAILYTEKLPPPPPTLAEIRNKRRLEMERKRKARLKAEKVNKQSATHIKVSETNSYRAPR